MAKKENKAAKKTKGLIADFKAFVSRGNVVDMAVGVIIGGAFSTIVTSVVNILMSVCTWWVPGGISGLVTVLPAVNDAQKGVDGIGQFFSTSDLTTMVIKYAANNGVTITSESDTFLQWKNSLLSLYTLHGSTYTYNMSAVIDWGTVINAVISFLIIAIVLFIVVKVVAAASAKRKDLEAKAQEAYYQKHPEERPVPAAPDAPKPTSEELLTQIRDLLKAQNAAQSEAAPKK